MSHWWPSATRIDLTVTYSDPEWPDVALKCLWGAWTGHGLPYFHSDWVSVTLNVPGRSTVTQKPELTHTRLLLTFINPYLPEAYPTVTYSNPEGPSITHSTLEWPRADRLSSWLGFSNPERFCSTYSDPEA